MVADEKWLVVVQIAYRSDRQPAPFATGTYQIGVGTGLLSEGAAVSLAIFPVLLLVVIIQLVYIRRVETV